MLALSLLLKHSILVLLTNSTAHRRSKSHRQRPVTKKFTKNNNEYLPLSIIASQSNAAILIDVENVRGKSGFQLTHMDVIDKVTKWAEHHDLQGKVSLVVDHGSMTCGYWLEKNKLGVVFAGPSQKADDVIARHVSLFDRTIVVTADTGLQRRCRKSTKHSIQIMPPIRLIDQLEQLDPQDATMNNENETKEQREKDDDDENNVFTDKIPLEEQINLGNLDTEIRLGGQLLEAEAILRTKKLITNKRKKKLEKRIQLLKEKLATRGPSMLNRVTSIIAGQYDSDENDNVNKNDILLQRWLYIRKTSPRKEETGDRIILAERLRRHIIDSGMGTKGIRECHENETAKIHVNHMNGALPISTMIRSSPSTITSKIPEIPSIPIISENEQKFSIAVDVTATPPQQTLVAVSKNGEEILTKHDDDTVPKLYKFSDTSNELSTLTLVVVSDTHGYEDQLTENGKTLPDGDILLHLGDYAMDGIYHHQSLTRFDSWLAQQPYKYKIVLRGNHDPFQFDFPLSQASYITKPMTVNLGGFILALVPHCSPRIMAASGGIPMNCDVLASHVPPYKELDRSITGRHCGSNFLTKIVRGMNGGHPRVWLCGHIHEQRGKKVKRFGRGRSTTIINASNANSGKASHLTHGPISIQLEAQKDSIDILTMEDNNMTHSIFDTVDDYDNDSDGNEPSRYRNEMLLSVDLGLNSGVSMFNNQGQLLRYQQFYFDNDDDLRLSARELINKWEDEVNAVSSSLSSTPSDNIVNKPWKITHIAIEGGDPTYRDAWAEAALDRCKILFVSPEEWRGELLLAKEKNSGPNAKAAARLIARQVVADYGGGTIAGVYHQGKFKTDVAESVVLGLYVARKLGWITTTPAVRRYTNGNVIIPKAFEK